MNIVSENVFIKSKGNALTSEAFADAVACVKSTCYNLRKANYGVNVLSDCITSYDKRKIDEMLEYYKSKGSDIITLSHL
jgi:lipopolysaccharide biosynthesis glycosyltransferase